MIDNLKTLIIPDIEEEKRYWALLADIEARINALEEDFGIIALDQAKIREDQAKIREDQAKLKEEISLELKYSEEDLAFYQNLSAQMKACLSIKV